MLALEKRIHDDLKTAMKNGEKESVQTYRFLLAQIKDERIKLRTKREIEESDVFKVITSAVKKRKESAEIYQQNNRRELAEKELQEIKIIEKYLPKQLTEAEIELIVKNAIAQTGANSMKDMGKVMGLAMKETAGKADGKTVQNMVRSSLI
jgi:uncharacterized protein YqeY